MELQQFVDMENIHSELLQVTYHELKDLLEDSIEHRVYNNQQYLSVQKLILQNKYHLFDDNNRVFSYMTLNRVFHVNETFFLFELFHLMFVIMICLFCFKVIW